MPNLVLLGIQGSGKGTQADLLRKNLGLRHLNIGSLLREEMKKETNIGLKVKKYMKKGDLVPDEYIFALIDPILHKHMRGIVLDGCPRTFKQAEFLEEKIPLRCAVYFELDDEIAKERLSNRRVCSKCKKNYNLLLNDVKKQHRCKQCGAVLERRGDDNDKAIDRRIKAFHKRTKPVIDFYLQRDKLITLDATNNPEQIHHQLVEMVNLKKDGVS